MNVMKRAWEIAKKGAAKFGGSVKSYFAQSLKLAWKEAKEEAMSVEEKIAQAFNFVARINKVDDLRVNIKFWNPSDINKARIYFNVGGTRKDLTTFYYSMKEDNFYGSTGGNATKREAVDNAIKIARANIEQIIREFVPAQIQAIL